MSNTQRNLAFGTASIAALTVGCGAPSAELPSSPGVVLPAVAELNSQVLNPEQVINYGSVAVRALGCGVEAVFEDRISLDGYFDFTLYTIDPDIENPLRDQLDFQYGVSSVPRDMFGEVSENGSYVVRLVGFQDVFTETEEFSVEVRDCEDNRQILPFTPNIDGKPTERAERMDPPKPLLGSIGTGATVGLGQDQECRYVAESTDYLEGTGISTVEITASEGCTTD